MASPQSLFKDIGEELAEFIAWARERLEDTDVRREIALDLGLPPDQPVPPVNLPADKLDSVERYRSQANPDREAFFILLNDVRAVVEATTDFARACGVSPEAAFNEGVYRLFDVLALNYFRLRHPKVYFVAQLLNALVEESSEVAEGDVVTEHFFGALAKAVEFLLSPIGYLAKSLWFGVEDEPRARLVSERTFPHLAAFLIAAGSIRDSLAPLETQEIIYGWDSLIKSDEFMVSPEPADPQTPVADEIAERMLSFAFADYERDPATRKIKRTAVYFSLAVVPQSHGASGLFIGVGGGGEVETPLGGKWKMRAEFSSPSAAAFLMQKDLAADGLFKGWKFSADGPNEARAVLSFVTTPDPETGVTFAAPDAEGTRLELGQLSFSVVLSAVATELKASADRCALVIAVKDTDGFIGKIIPDDGLRIPVNFGVGFSEQRGFFTEGNIPFLSGRSTSPTQPPSPAASAAASGAADAAAQPEQPSALSAGKAPQLGLEKVIPVGRRLGPVTIRQVMIGLFPPEDPASSKMTAEVSTSLTVNFGPVLATVDRIGFQFKLDFPRDGGGNAGFADFALGLRPPAGVGLKVDSQIVTGGGFLAFDPDRGQYAGAIHLDIQDRLSVSAIGLIATRLPGGAKGFSLLIIITAQDFVPIPLGLGFKLTGIGGLVAINRTFDEGVLRAGLKEGMLDSVLFPKDPIRNAPQILSNLNRVFPVAEGHHLFGPVVEIKWGTPTLITMKLGVVLELGARLRLLVLGQVSALLPKPELALVRLKLDAVGVLDFDQGTASLDATLHDSRLADKFVLTGDMAMRLKWESPHHFALAVGGLHRAFNPPPNFPKLERVSINLSSGDNPRFRCEAYFAITSNTVQFGARAELFAAASEFSIHGEVSFDVLIQFDPFFFVADFSAQVQVKHGRRNLFKVSVEGALSGPRPLHVRAKASIELLFFSVSISINKTLVEGEKPPPPAPVDVFAQLKEALGSAGNWVAVLPAGQRQMVTLRARTAAPDEVLLHPLGTLTVRQSVAPLNVTISRFGQTTPTGARSFKITGVSFGDQSLGLPATVEDLFAPAQFFEMSDDEKLSRPSFEPMAAGVSLGSNKVSFPANADDIVTTPAVEFETVIIDKGLDEKRSDRDDHTKPKFQLTPQLLARHYPFGAAGVSELRRTGTDKYRAATAGKYQVTREGWKLVSVEDLSAQPVATAAPDRPATYTEAVEELRGVRRRDPALAAGMDVVRPSDLK